MSRSWGHTIRELTEAEHASGGRTKCSAPLCPERPQYLCEYEYFSGRRNTSSRRDYCVGHATKFAHEHGLERPMAHEHEYGAPEHDPVTRRYKRYCECGSFVATEGYPQ